MHQQFEQAMPISEKTLVLSCRQLVAGARKINFNGLPDPRRRTTEHEHAIAEINCLFEVVSYEYGGDLLFRNEL